MASYCNRRRNRKSRQNLCYCSGPVNLQSGMSFGHKKDHPMCDCHPHGFYNQTKFREFGDEDIALEYFPASNHVTAFFCRFPALPALKRNLLLGAAE